MNFHERKSFNMKGALHVLLLFVCVAVFGTVASAQKSRSVPGDGASKKIRAIEPAPISPEGGPTPIATTTFSGEAVSCGNLADRGTFANVNSSNGLRLNFGDNNFNFSNASFFFKTYSSAQGPVVAVPPNDPAFSSKTITVSVNETTNLGVNNTHTISSFMSELGITAVIMNVGGDSVAFNYDPATQTGGPLTATRLHGITYIEFCFSSGLGPSAADVSAGGRVTDRNGRGLRGVGVFVTDTFTGETRYAITSPFGYYSFDNLEAGRLYFVSVSSKQYSFSESVRAFTLNDNLSNLDFVANP